MTNGLPRLFFVLLWTSLGGAALAGDSVFFEPNRGQASEEVLFIARAPGSTVSISGHGIELAPAAPGVAPVELRLAGARLARWEADGPLPGSTSYEVGRRGSWVANVPHFGKIVSRGVYPGVDWVIRGASGRLEYDLIIAPGADPDRIELSFNGAEAIELTQAGGLLLRTRTGRVIHKAPVTYQESSSGRVEVRSRYRITGPNRARFETGDYDRSRVLVIDPVIEGAAWLGLDRNSARVFAAGARGFRIAGSTPSVAPGQAGKLDAFEYQPYTGQLVIFGGSGDDIVTAAIEGTIAGYTNSPDLEARDGYPGRSTYGGGDWDGFVRTLAPDSFPSPFLQYVGGSGDDRIMGLSAVGFVGHTSSRDFPVSFAWQPENAGGVDGFVVLRTGVSSYLGGPGDDWAMAIGYGPGEDVWVAGETKSAGWLRGAASGAGGFAVRLAPRDGEGPLGVGVAAAAFMGPDIPIAVCVTPDGPVLGGYSIRPGEDRGIWVSRRAKDLSGIRWTGRLGGSGADELAALTCSESGDVLAGGSTGSRDFPVTDSGSGYAGGDRDAFLALWDARGRLLFASLYGGSSSDGISAVHFANGAIEAAGSSDSGSIPIVQGFGSRGKGVLDAFHLVLSHRWIGTPAQIFVGRNLTAPIVARINAPGRAGVPLTVSSSAPRRVAVSARPDSRGMASLVFAQEAPLDSRAIWAHCLEAEGEAVVSLSAPGYEDVETTVRCAPSAIQASGNRTAVRFVAAAIDPDSGVPVPQAPSPNPGPLRIRVTGHGGFSAEVTLPPGGAGGAELSLGDSGPAEVTLSSPDEWRFLPSNRLTLRAPASVTAPVVAAGVSSTLPFTGPAGRATFRSSDPSIALLSTRAEGGGQAELTITHSLRFDNSTGFVNAVPLYVQGLRTGPYSITAEFEGSDPVTGANVVTELELRFVLALGTTRLFAVHETELRVGERTPPNLWVTGFPRFAPLVRTLFGTPVRFGPAIRFRLESSSPTVSVPSEPFTFRPDGVFASPNPEIRALAPGVATIRIVAENSPVPMATVPIRVVVKEPVPAVLPLGGNLQELLLEAPSSGPPVTVTSSDRTKAVVTLDPALPGAASVTTQPELRRQVWVQGLADSGTVELLVTRPGEPPSKTIVQLSPSGLAWRERMRDIGPGTCTAADCTRAILEPWALDPVTLEPRVVQRQIPSVSLSTAAIFSSAPAIVSVGSLELTAQGLGLVSISANSSGVAVLSIRQPGGFTAPSRGGELPVRSRTGP